MAGAGVMQRWAQTPSLLSFPPAIPSHPSQPWYRPHFQQEETSSALWTVSTSPCPALSLPLCPFPTLLGWMDGARAPDGLGLHGADSTWSLPLDPVPGLVLGSQHMITESVFHPSHRAGARGGWGEAGFCLQRVGVGAVWAGRASGAQLCCTTARNPTRFLILFSLMHNWKGVMVI